MLPIGSKIYVWLNLQDNQLKNDDQKKVKKAKLNLEKPA